jgi:hypothetical protein
VQVLTDVCEDLGDDERLREYMKVDVTIASEGPLFRYVFERCLARKEESRLLRLGHRGFGKELGRFLEGRPQLRWLHESEAQAIIPDPFAILRNEREDTRSFRSMAGFGTELGNFSGATALCSSIFQVSGFQGLGLASEESVRLKSETDCRDISWSVERGSGDFGVSFPQQSHRSESNMKRRSDVIGIQSQTNRVAHLPFQIGRHSSVNKTMFLYTKIGHAFLVDNPRYRAKE